MYLGKGGGEDFGEGESVQRVTGNEESLEELENSCRMGGKETVFSRCEERVDEGRGQVSSLEKELGVFQRGSQM